MRAFQPNGRSWSTIKEVSAMAKMKNAAPIALRSHDPAGRGYCVVYRENEVNHCPGCGRTHWFVGRTTAECGFCSTALPLASASTQGTGGLCRGHYPVITARAA
jgi:hypothetical protein